MRGGEHALRAVPGRLDPGVLTTSEQGGEPFDLSGGEQVGTGPEPRRSPSRCLNTCLARPSTMSSCREGPHAVTDRGEGDVQ